MLITLPHTAITISITEKSPHFDVELTNIAKLLWLGARAPARFQSQSINIFFFSNFYLMLGFSIISHHFRCISLNHTDLTDYTRENAINFGWIYADTARVDWTRRFSILLFFEEISVFIKKNSERTLHLSSIRLKFIFDQFSRNFQRARAFVIIAALKKRIKSR